MNKTDKIFGYATMVIIFLITIGCASTSGSPSEERLNGSEFMANDIGMIATEAWGNATVIASFEPGVTERGVEAVEVELPYGENAVVYNFHDLGSNQPVEFNIDTYFDTFMTDSFIEIYIMPGDYSVEDAVWPRLEFDDYLAFKYIDSVGRFAGSEYPDATDGWERLYSNEYNADENGDVSVIFIINHWTETPPAVYHYFTNPEVTTLKEEV